MVFSPVTLRHQLFAAAYAQVDARLRDLDAQLAALDGAQAGETKSSAGDKFETARERMQQERDRLLAQRGVMREHRMRLELAERAPRADAVGLGSAVRLADGRRLLLATGLGKVRLADGAAGYVLSLESPLGAALLGCRPGAPAVAGGRSVEVRELG